jgi:sphinganine-1-phosphate aldolase
MAVNDRHFKQGRIFSLAYFAGDDVYNVGRAAHDQFLGGNALNTDVFPSLRDMQNDVLAAMTDLLHGSDDAAGVMTSGGTESILCAVLGARELAHLSRPYITRPEIVLPTTAHAAFSKAAHYFGAATIRVPVGPDFRADPAAMRAAITPNTILLVGSAPSYPQGVIDPIEEIAALAIEHALPCHVDACMGGFVLPFMEQLGIEVRPWDFRVPGVTSISADNHKYGYAPKGASVLIYANRSLRKQQFFITTDWLGGLYGSQGLMGTRPGGPIAGAWAVMYHLGAEGYREHTQRSYDTARKLITAINNTPGVRVVGEPEATLVAWTSDPKADSPVDIFAVGDALKRRDWFCDRQGPPDSLHCTVNSVHANVIDDFIADVAEAVVEVAGASADDRTAQYGTLDT